jgi:hypothetical protein
MRRAFFACLFLAGCTLPPEREAVRPLPEDTQPLTYAELIARARSQAAAANEAFYRDRWVEMDEAARALEQTARFLTKAKEVPLTRRDNLAVHAGDLGKGTERLREAVLARDPKRTNEALQQLHLLVRELRVDN